MPSIHRTQLRLQQVSGSLNSGVGASADLGSAQDILDQMARSLKEIKGTEFTSAVQTSKLKDQEGHDRIEYVQDAGLKLYSEDGTTVAMTIGSTGANTDVVIAGDLTVNGTTTTVNSTRLDIADELIQIGDGNNNGVSNARDLGFIFERFGQAAQQTITSQGDGNANHTNAHKQVLRKLTLQNTAGTTKVFFFVDNSTLGGSPLSNGATIANDQKIAENASSNDIKTDSEGVVVLFGTTNHDTLTNLKNAIEGDNGFGNAFPNGMAVTVPATGGTPITITLTQKQDGSAGNNRTCAMNNTALFRVGATGGQASAAFGTDGAQIGVNGNVALAYDHSANVMKLGRTADSADSADAELSYDSLGTNGVPLALKELQIVDDTNKLGLSGSDLELNAAINVVLRSSGATGATELRGSNSNASRLKFFSGSNYVQLKAPESLGGAREFVLPNAVPSVSGQALICSRDSATAGTFSFATVPTTADSSKSVVDAKESISFLKTLGAFDAAFRLPIPAGILGAGGLDDVDDSRTMVFMNGQLLMSGSVNEVGNGEADYRFVPVSSQRASIELTVDSTHHGNAADNDKIETYSWQDQDTGYVRVQDSSNANLRVKTDPGNGSVIVLETEAGADANPDNIVVGDVVEISKTGEPTLYKRVSAISTNQVTLQNLDGTTFNFAADDNHQTAAVSVAAHKLVIHIEKSSDDTGGDANGTFSSDTTNHQASGTGDKLRKSIVVNLKDTATHNTAQKVRDQIKLAINQNSGQHGLVAEDGSSNNKVQLLVTRALDNRANDSLVTLTMGESSANKPFSIPGSPSKFSGASALDAHSVKLAFGLEIDDVLVVKTS